MLNNEETNSKRNEPQRKTISNYLKLPLKNMFCNRKAEFDFTYNDMKIIFENLRTSQSSTKTNYY